MKVLHYLGTNLIDALVIVDSLERVTNSCPCDLDPTCGCKHIILTYIQELHDYEADLLNYTRRENHNLRWQNPEYKCSSENRDFEAEYLKVHDAEKRSQLHAQQMTTFYRREFANKPPTTSNQFPVVNIQEGSDIQRAGCITWCQDPSKLRPVSKT